MVLVCTTHATQATNDTRAYGANAKRYGYDHSSVSHRSDSKLSCRTACVRLTNRYTHTCKFTRSRSSCTWRTWEMDVCECVCSRSVLIERPRASGADDRNATQPQPHSGYDARERRFSALAALRARCVGKFSQSVFQRVRACSGFSFPHNGRCCDCATSPSPHLSQTHFAFFECTHKGGLALKLIPTYSAHDTHLCNVIVIDN